jgi:hypothetical protein
MPLKIINWDAYLKQLKSARDEAASRGLKGAELNAEFEADKLRCLVARIDADLAEKLDALESRIRSIEDRGLKYCGVYQRASTYQRGDVTTHKGALWICLQPTFETPGASDSWQLAVKAA